MRRERLFILFAGLVLVLLAGCATTDALPETTAGDTPAFVVDKATKKPVTAFTVTPLHHGADPAGSWEAGSPTSVQDKRGRFRVPNDPTAAALRIDAPGYLPAIVPVSQQAQSPLEVMLERGAVLRGRITSSEGAVLEGVTVHYELNLPQLRRQQTKTDAKGEYVVTMNPGDHTFRFEKEGWIPEEKHYKVVDGANARLDLKLMAARTVAGVVRDDTGSPVPRVRVRARWSDGSDIREANTNDTGQFELKPIRSGTHTFELSKGGYPVTTIPSVVVPSEPLQLVLPRGAIVTGTVSGASDAEKAFVFIYFANGMMTGINQEGRFGLPGIPPGRTTVYAEVADVGRVKRSPSKEIELQNGGRTEVRLDFNESTKVGGTVREGDKPAARVVIGLLPQGAPTPIRVVTDENGQYSVVGLAPGRYTVEVQGRPLLSNAIVDIAGDMKLDLVVGPAKPIDDRTRQPTPAPPPGD